VDVFASTISMATGTIADAGGLLKSVRFPRTVMPMATVLFNLAASHDVRQLRR
jgi:ABC-type polysaccharide/polyol phosphate export permease